MVKPREILLQDFLKYPIVFSRVSGYSPPEAFRWPPPEKYSEANKFVGNFPLERNEILIKPSFSINSAVKIIQMIESGKFTNPSVSPLVCLKAAISFRVR